MNSQPTVTFWYHPESDCVWMHDSVKDGILDPDLGDGMSSSIDEYTYVSKLIEQIEADPDHKLPEGVDAILRGAYPYPHGGLHGQIYYDRHGRFPNGDNVNIAKVVEILPGGIYKTKNSTYIVHMIDPSVTGFVNNG